ncbi:MAG: hypothetical protein M4D80_08775 [Myxococcota bacterium]|nr:hypothetical protein [Deltaproteobacteria bacterium]MDQ3335243.1 hypothetical protein [Myxococcota bacterium]
MIVDELRELIITSAPDPAQAAPVRTCRADEPLDGLIPFSSVIVLGTVIAVEDRYGITVRRADLQRALAGGVTLEKLATMIEELR